MATTEPTPQGTQPTRPRTNDAIARPFVAGGWKPGGGRGGRGREVDAAANAEAVVPAVVVAAIRAHHRHQPTAARKPRRRGRESRRRPRTIEPVRWFRTVTGVGCVAGALALAGCATPG